LVVYETCGYYLGHENVYGMIGALGAHMATTAGVNQIIAAEVALVEFI
jgi:hypothetical protein